MHVDILNSLPERFLEVSPQELDSIFQKPTLIHLEGRRNPALFVSILLHGNEVTGLLAIQKLLKTYQNLKRKLPRSLSLFVGNISAAAAGLRRLPGQPDFNRIWDGGELPEHQMAQEVLTEMKEKTIFASIDIHNNTGKNPHYACVNSLDLEFVNLGRLFSRTLVYFTEPHEVNSNAFAKLCPAVTIESGLSGDAEGVEHVAEYVDSCLHLEHLPKISLKKSEVDIYHTIARIKVPENCKLGFGEEEELIDFAFPAHFDEFNFSELDQNALIGLRHNKTLKLQVTNSQNEDVAEQYLKYEQNEIRVKKRVIPSMFTKNKKVIFQDCLGYLMERYQPH